MNTNYFYIRNIDIHKYTGAVRDFLEFALDTFCWEVIASYPVNDSTARTWRIKHGKFPIHSYALGE